MGKYKDLIDKAKKTKNQATKKPDDQKTGKPESQIKDGEAQLPEEKEVNLCVKVPISLRQHWAAEAKRQGTTMTSVIVEALSEKFGKPDNW